MSGHSGSAPCPVCGSDMTTYIDWKPFDYVSGECLGCGFTYWTKTARLSLEDINAIRMEYDLDPIKQRKPWDKVTVQQFGEE